VYISRNKVRVNIKFVLLVSVLLILGGCSSGYAPVSDLSITQNNRVEIVRSSRNKRAPATYRVRSGDTLYSIAWRYGLDYRELSNINNIGQDFRINVGQKLRLKAPQAASKTAATSSVNNSANAAGQESDLKVPQVATQSNTRVGNAKVQVPSNTEKQLATVKSAKPSSSGVSVSSYSNTQKVSWQWPTNGNLIGKYSSSNNINKGINLEGKRGDPVYAAATGKVVYAGSGLLGYGNLIIINHNKEYLSAYAHNSRILVKENDNVNVGAQVAEIGNSGATRMMLHFEIRKDGKPVNPLQYLPKR
jgi:lipoprotein NlpD